MFCSKCGNKLKEGSTFCGKCGHPVNDKEKNSNKKINLSFFKNKIFIGASSIVIAIIIIYLIIFNIGKSNLSKELLRDWSRVETGDSGSLYRVVLDFSKDKIEYNFESGYSWLNTTIATYDYKVISPNKIKAKDKTYTIKFNKDKTMMTITPAITKIGDSEDWYNTDDE